MACLGPFLALQLGATRADAPGTLSRGAELPERERARKKAERRRRKRSLNGIRFDLASLRPRPRPRPRHQKTLSPSFISRSTSTSTSPPASSAAPRPSPCRATAAGVASSSRSGVSEAWLDTSALDVLSACACASTTATAGEEPTPLLLLLLPSRSIRLTPSSAPGSASPSKTPNQGGEEATIKVPFRRRPGDGPAVAEPGADERREKPFPVLPVPGDPRALVRSLPGHPGGKSDVRREGDGPRGADPEDERARRRKRREEGRGGRKDEEKNKTTKKRKGSPSRSPCRSLPTSSHWPWGSSRGAT